MERMCTFFVAAAIVAVTLSGCATQQEKAPECEGAYTPVNPRDKYPDLVEKDLQERAKKGGVHQ